mmetsp:Transcript_21401/g.47431  ORF Transcript_21401/g.47431 Transcript_21401/m.47431 type:complete len:548 (-) Transcript_21401:83-1726(-)
MGKNQHSKDGLHLRPTEWAQDGAGYKQRKRSPFAKLPLHCCSLSLQPFESPVATRDGAVFEVSNILAYVKKFGRNPVTGGRLEVSELIPLHFHHNAEGKIQCPVTFKVFTDNSHVAANLASGHVYSYDTLVELNRKVKNFTDLITSKPFEWTTDVVVLQDPDNIEAREVAKFYYMQQGQQDQVIAEITDREAAKKGITREKKNEKIRKDAAFERIYEEKKRLAEEKEQEAAAKGETPSDASAVAIADRPRKTNERFTSGEVAESFTSTATPLRSQNNMRLLTEEEELQEIYELVRRKKEKGYVRIVTSEGMLNIELHTDIVPLTTDNFLRLCERNYFDDTIFHRLIKNFMIQGGDPEGTGRGGQSGFDGGKAFRDEFDSRLSHQGPGVVSMANNGKNTNRSQFFVSLKSCAHLDLKHAVFGRVVGGLNLLTVLNGWETDDKDRPRKEIKLIRTEVFKNPFKEAAIEAAKPKAEKVVDNVAQWFSNRRDPMEKHKNRSSTAVGKYLELPAPALAKKQPVEELPEEEMEYVNVAQKVKKPRTDFDFTTW